MIFATTGTQEPFDRFVKAIDELAAKLPDVTFNVQAFADKYVASNIKILDLVSPTDFDNYVKSSKLIISHAGMGTIISALVNSKPIIVMPRLIKYHEHRNEHQLATARKLEALGYVDVAYDEQALISKVMQMWPNDLKCLHNVSGTASEKLLYSLNNFIEQ